MFLNLTYKGFISNNKLKIANRLKIQLTTVGYAIPRIEYFRFLIYREEV